MSDKKQIPFRYGPQQEKEFEFMFKLQGWTSKKNEALCDALEIAATLINKFESEHDVKDLDSWDYGYKFKVWFKDLLN